MKIYCAINQLNTGDTHLEIFASLKRAIKWAEAEAGALCQNEMYLKELDPYEGVIYTIQYSEDGSHIAIEEHDLEFDDSEDPVVTLNSMVTAMEATPSRMRGSQLKYLVDRYCQDLGVEGMIELRALCRQLMVRVIDSHELPRS